MCRASINKEKFACSKSEKVKIQLVGEFRPNLMRIKDQLWRFECKSEGKVVEVQNSFLFDLFIIEFCSL